MFKTLVIAISVFVASTVFAQGNLTSITSFNGPTYYTTINPVITFTHKSTVLQINSDGTLIFFDKTGQKIRDYDPGPEARDAIKSGVEDSFPCPSYNNSLMNGNSVQFKYSNGPNTLSGVQPVK